MQLLLDNLSASIITLTLFMMLVVINHRDREAQVQEAYFYSLRQQQVNFTQTLHRDMAGIVRVHQVQEEPSDLTFSFTTRLADQTDTTHVTYKRRKVGELNGVDLYQIHRYENAPAGTLDPNAYMGGSMPTIAAWTMVAQNEDGNIPVNSADARQIFVRFETVMPFESASEQVRWPYQATYRPVFLRPDKTL